MNSLATLIDFFENSFSETFNNPEKSAMQFMSGTLPPSDTRKPSIPSTEKPYFSQQSNNLNASKILNKAVSPHNFVGTKGS